MRIPAAISGGTPPMYLTLATSGPKLLIGGSDVTGCGSGLAFNDCWLLRVREPEEHSKRWRLSARFSDRNGDLACEIRDNELILPARAFDIQQTARTLVVRRDQDVVLELELLPPTTLAVNRYVKTTPSGVIFIGRRCVPHPFGSGESLRSVVPVDVDGDIQMFVDCAFKADVGLNLCVTDAGLVTKNQAVVEMHSK